MDTLKINTLDQVSDALDAVEDARATKGLSAADKNNLETASLKLRDLERSIIKSVQDELVDTLTSDCTALKALTEQIDKSAKKLDALAGALEKATKAVDGLITVIIAAAGAGLFK
jgi:hypothetical protein